MDARGHTKDIVVPIEDVILEIAPFNRFIHPHAINKREIGALKTCKRLLQYLSRCCWRLMFRGKFGEGVGHRSVPLGLH